MTTVAQWHCEIGKKTHVLLKELKKHFSITTLTKIHTFSWNAVFYASGDKEEFCVKIINEMTSGVLRTVQDLNFTATIAIAFARLGFTSVLPPVQSKCGEYVIRCGDYWAIVFPWLPWLGQCRLTEDGPQSADAIKRAIVILANMHAKSAQVAVDVLEPPIRDLPYAYSPSVWAQRSEHLWNMAEHNLVSRCGSKECLAEIKSARTQAEKLIQENGWFFRDPPQRSVIHGDFKPENLITNPQKSLLYDWDVAHMSRPEVDVAHGALTFSGPRWLLGPLNWDACRFFLKTCGIFSEHLISSTECLDVALRWSVVKTLSLSFKEEQVRWRALLYRELTQKLSMGLVPQTG